jgi:glycosyltransferase involved in cell wall biosynthesis
VESVRDLVVKNPVGHLCDIITGYRSNRIICPSPDLANLLKYCFVDERKIHVIPNGIDPKVFDEIDSDTDFLDKHAIENEPFVLYIGRLYSLKGVHYLIKAFQSIKKEHTNLKLVIAGSGDFEPYLRKIALGTRDILFVGHIDSLAVKKLLYEKCFTVVVPSIYETFPMVVLEAMVCSKPVVASNVGGIRLLIKHGKNGFLVKPKDVRGLEAFINKLYEDPNLRKKMGMFGRKLVEKEFTVGKMVDETLKVYESLLQT